MARADTAAPTAAMGWTMRAAASSATRLNADVMNPATFAIAPGRGGRETRDELLEVSLAL